MDTNNSIDEMEKILIENKELIAHRDELIDIVKAVAHIGIDFGYGPFVLSDDHIERARAVITKIEAQSC